MAAMFSRSNAISPIPSLNQDTVPGHIPLGVSRFVANHEYSALQLLDFILEAQNQAKPGAFPTKGAFNYRFLDAEAAPRFPADIIAEWVVYRPALSPLGSNHPHTRTSRSAAIDCRQLQATPQSYVPQHTIYEGPARHDRGRVFQAVQGLQLLR